MSFGPGKKLWECPQRCLGDSSTVIHVQLVCPFIVCLWMRRDYAFLSGHKTKNKWKGKSPSPGKTVKGWKNGGGGCIISKEANLFNFLMLLWDKIEFQCECRLANGPLSEQAAYWQRMVKGMGGSLKEACHTASVGACIYICVSGFWCGTGSSGECGCVWCLKWARVCQIHSAQLLCHSWTQKSLPLGHDLTSCFSDKSC